MPSRRLSLRREPLAELSSDELAGVVGAEPNASYRSIVDDCPSGRELCSLLCPQSWHTEEC